MKMNISKKLTAATAKALTSAAKATAGQACIISMYQPKAPKSLQK